MLGWAASSCFAPAQPPTNRCLSLVPCCTFTFTLTFLCSRPHPPQQLCAKECKDKDKALFGLQYGTECWCSGSKSGYDKYGKGNKCDMPCGGDSEQMCGGRFAMEVYEVPSSPAPAPGPMPKPPSPMPKPPSGGSFVCDGLLDSKGEVCCKVRFSERCWLFEI